jgi:hypothetical protein
MMGVVGVVVFYNMWTTNKYAYTLIRTTHHLSCCCFDSLDRYKRNCIFLFWPGQIKLDANRLIFFKFSLSSILKSYFSLSRKKNQVFLFSSKFFDNADQMKFENHHLRKKKSSFLDKDNINPSFHFSRFFFLSIPIFFLALSPSLCYSPLRLRPVPRVCDVCVVDDNHSSSKHMEDHMWVRKREKKKQKERQNSWLPFTKR